MRITKIKKYRNFEIFVLQIWKNPAIRQKILSYQNRYNTTSVAILWCMWHDMHHAPLHTKTIIHILKYTKKYEKNHIIPMRNKRRLTKKGTETYNRLLQSEIQAEMRLCKLMIKIFPHPIPHHQTMRSNVSVYLKLFKISAYFPYF